MAGGKEEYHAFFYSLVSTVTQVCLTNVYCISFSFGFIPFPDILEMENAETMPVEFRSTLAYDIFFYAGNVLFNKKATIPYRSGI